MARPREFKEEEVLKKALDLFWKQGYHATSMDHLVKELGVNRGGIYNTFKNKKGLFYKAFDMYRNENINYLLKFLDAQPTVKEGIKNLFFLSIKEAFEDQDNKGCFAINCAMEMVPNDNDMLSILTGNRERFEQIFYTYLQKGVEKGEISADKDLKALSTLLFTLYNGLKVVAKTQSNESELVNGLEVGLSVLD